MRHLLGLLGDPHRRLRTVLVAGTKGKGSTAVMIAAILRARGLRIGLTVKPHLVEYRERIQVAGHRISRADVAALVERVRPAIEGSRDLVWGAPTYVETTVAMAFLHFAESKVDLAVVEVGIGGRLDATNVLDPLVSIITPISYDHTEILGDTLTAIAAEKAGIVRAGGRVVSAPQADEAMRTIARVCEDQRAHLVVVGRDIGVRLEASSLQGVRAVIRGLRDSYSVRVPLLGRHQAINAATAIGAVELLADESIPVGADAVRRGLATVRWPARVELIDTAPYTIIDVGHNPASMAALRDTLQELLGGRRLIVVFGMLATKDYRTVTAMVAPLADAVVTTTPDNPHALHRSRHRRGRPAPRGRARTNARRPGGCAPRYRVVLSSRRSARVAPPEEARSAGEKVTPSCGSISSLRTCSSCRPVLTSSTMPRRRPGTWPLGASAG